METYSFVGNSLGFIFNIHKIYISLKLGGKFDTILQIDSKLSPNKSTRNASMILDFTFKKVVYSSSKFEIIDR